MAVSSRLFTNARRSSELDAGTTASAAVLGAPLELTESFRPGAAEGPQAVRYFSDSLETYSRALGRDLDDLTLVDAGDVSLEDLTIEEAVEAIADATEAAASLARLVCVIGGEHTVSLGAFRGIRRVHGDAALVQLDAHLDFREEYEGEALTHASWLYHAGAESGFENIVQCGVRSGERSEWPRARELLGWSSERLELPDEVRSRLGERPVYLTIDIDVLDPAHAPGTGCPEPGGVTFGELEAFLHGLADLPVVGLDIVEVAPSLDPAGITAAAAAKLVRECLLMFASGDG